MIGKKITTANRLLKLANSGKAVYHRHWGRHTSASWIMSIPFRTVVAWLNSGILYEYKSKTI